MLIELGASEYPRARPLFPPSYPNLAFVDAVLERRIPGRVWAQPGEQGPAACLVATGFPLCFAAGAVTPEMFDEMRARLEDRPPVKLVHPPALAAVAPGRGFVAAERLQFGEALRQGERRQACVPAGFELRRIDAELFPRLGWKDAVLAIFGSAENYLDNGYGFCLLHAGRLVAEAHGVVGGERVELGTHTHEEYRQKGLATIVCAAVARHGAERGLGVVATCDAEKAASVGVAQSIGLCLELRYPIASLQR